MTTKNFEIDFDLQMFALSDITPTLRASGGDVYVDGSDTATTTTGQVAGDEQYSTDTVRSSADAYAFSSDKATVSTESVTISSGTKTTLTTTVTDTLNSGTPQTISSVQNDPANISVTSNPLWLAGGGQSSTIIIKGNAGGTAGGTIQAFNSGSDHVALTVSSANLGLSSVYGSNGITYTPFEGKMNQSINGSLLNFSVTPNSTVKIEGGSNEPGNPTITAATAANLSSINSGQTWIVGNTNSVAYKNLTVATNYDTDTAAVSAIDSSGSYLSVTAGANVGVSLTGSANADTVSFNGRTISGVLGKGAFTLSGGEEGNTLVTAKAGSAASLTAGGGSVSLMAAGATASITGAASVAAITAVDKLASGGRWTLGSNVTSAQLGADTVTFTEASANNILTADSDGTKVSAISSLSAGNVTLAGVGTHSSIAVGSGAANWGYTTSNATDTVVAVFDTVGSMSLQAETSATVNLNSRTAKVFGVGTNDSLSLNGQGKATVAGGIVTAVDSLSAGGEWTVQGGTDRSVVLGSDTIGFARAADNLYGVITAGTQGNKAAIISDLAGDVSVKSGSSVISGLQVVENVWTISGAVDSVAAFDSLGTSATVTAQNSDLTVAATSNASVVVNGQSTAVGGKFNGVTVATNDSDSLIVVQLEGVSDTVTANLAGITSLNSAATVTGDSLFSVNDTYTVQNLKTNSTKVSVASGSSAITIQSVSNNDAYSVTGGNVVYDLNSGSNNVTVNGAQVSITAATTSGSASSTNAMIYGSGNDAVVTVTGVKLNDTIRTANDSDFTVVYDVPANLTSDTYVMNANNVGVSLNSGNIGAATKITMSVDNSSSSRPHVTISGGLSNSSTISVGSGVYNVGSSAAVTINESLGYLYLDSAGNVTAEDNSVADVRKYRDDSLNTLASAQDSLGATINAFNAFYNAYDHTVNANYNSNVSLVAGFESSVTAASEVATVASTSGVNIYGDSALTGNPEQLTLQSYLSNPIAIKKIEGANSDHTVRTAVVDARGGSASIIALGMDQSQEKFATNHTIYGSSRASTIMVGPQATGNHVVRAGSVGSYLYHNAGGNGGTASIFGGAGNDTIIAEKGDHVEGGSGADVFFDSQAYEISDYRPEEGDIIIATKLSSAASANFTPDNLVISGNTVAIAGGSTITIGSNYDEATAVRAAIANANNSERKYLIWAGTYESNLDASSLDRGIMMISSVNGGAADTVTGSGYADSIYAGGNDYVNSGAGNDLITLKAADSDTGQRGATVALSAGRNEVYGWQKGFANDEGANVLEADAATTSFRTRNGVVTATNGESIMSFTGLTEDEKDGGYKFLVGGQKVTFIGEGQKAIVRSNDDLAAYYKADKAGEVVVTSDVTTAFTVNLSDTATFNNITSVELNNNSRATVIGSSAAEKVTLAGDRDSGAHKTIMSGGGNDLIVSGGIYGSNASAVAGNHLFFGTGSSVYSSGRDTVQGFNYYTGKDNDPDGSSADVLHLGNVANFNGVSVMSGRVEISLGESATVVLSDTFTSSADNKVVRATFDDLDTVYNVKFGVGGTAQNTFTYDGETNYYWGNAGRSRDTLNVAANLSNVNIWLDNKDLDSTLYQGIGVIDAHNLVDTKASLVGNYSNTNPYGTTINNTIISGGSGMQTSLWGGGGESNLLIGGDGVDEFFFLKGYGYTDSDGNRHGSNVTINNVASDDLIRLYDMTLDDIDLSTITLNGSVISANLKDQNGVKGGSITVTGFGQETNFKFSDGSTYKAVVRGSNIGWE